MGINFVKVESVDEDGRFIPEKLAKIDDETHRALARSTLREGDILFSIAGAIGRAAMVRQPILPANTNQAIAILRPIPSKVDGRWLYYYLRSAAFQDFSLGRVVQTAQANVSLGVLKAAPIALPTPLAQRRIASILSAYDDLIENNTRRIAILEEMARRSYEEWFVRFRFPGHERVRMVESALGLMPEGWRVYPMNEVAEVVDCLHSKKPGEEGDGAGVVLQLFNIADDGILDLSKKYRVSEADYAKWTSRMEAIQGDCVITNVGRVGAVAQVPRGVKAALGRNMTGVRAKQNWISRACPEFCVRGIA